MISSTALRQVFDIIIGTGFDWKAMDERLFFCSCHPKQYDFLYNAHHKENVLHAGNGFGKTEIPARKHIAFLLKHFDNKEYKTLNVALTQEQASLVLERIVKICNNSPLLSWLIKDTRMIKGSYTDIIWSNGAVTRARTLKNKGEAIEGAEYGYISGDEVALEAHLEFIRDFILLPRLRKYKDSQLDFLATPKGLNAFYRVTNAIRSAGGYVMGGSSYDNPFVEASHWDYICRGKSESFINQVIKGLFIDNSNFLFASRIDKILDTTLSFEPPEIGRKYVDGWDLARGRKSDIADSTVKYTLKVPLDTLGKFVVVDRWKGQVPWTDKGMNNENTRLGEQRFTTSIESEIRRSRMMYNTSSVFIDSTGLGDTLYERVQDIATGIDFRGHKDNILTNLQVFIDEDRLGVPYISDLVEQLTTYSLDDKQLSTDDVMALAVAVYGVTKYVQFSTRYGSTSTSRKNILPNNSTFTHGTKKKNVRTIAVFGQQGGRL